MSKKAHVFLIDENDDLVHMAESPYSFESDLQELLARHPDLLAGEQIDPDNPRRWLFVGREIGVPAAEDEAGWWSLDHLFLDQAGVPTFVECKRAANTQSRRQVVAQMLDYAANGTAYWSVEKIKAEAEKSAAKGPRSLNDELTNLLGPEADLDTDTFWDEVDENLRSGHVRLLFVLDHAPRELRRLVEFLNEKTTDVELAVVEVKRYSKDGTHVVVPRVYGLTEATITRKTDPRKPRLTKSKFLAACDPTAREFFDQVFNEAETRKWDIYWGTTGCSLRAPVGPGGGWASLIYFYPKRDFVLYFSHLDLEEEDTQELRTEFQEIGNLRLAGGYTLKQDVTTQTVDDLKKVVDHMMKRVDGWIDAGEIG